MFHSHLYSHSFRLDPSAEVNLLDLTAVILLLAIYGFSTVGWGTVDKTNHQQAVSFSTLQSTTMLRKAPQKLRSPERRRKGFTFIHCVCSMKINWSLWEKVSRWVSPRFVLS